MNEQAIGLVPLFEARVTTSTAGKGGRERKITRTVSVFAPERTSDLIAKALSDPEFLRGLGIGVARFATAFDPGLVASVLSGAEAPLFFAREVHVHNSDDEPKDADGMSPYSAPEDRHP